MVKKEHTVELAVLIIVVVIAAIGLFLLFKVGAGELFGQAVSRPAKGVFEKPASAAAPQKTVNQLTQVLLIDSTRPSKQQLADVSVAAQRKEKLLALMEKNPAEALELVIPKDVRNKFRPEVQANIEEEVEIEGTLEVLHVDDFVNYGGSKYLHFLRVGEKRISLHSDQDLLGIMPVISGSTVRTKGAKLDNKLISKGTPENFKVLVEEKPHASEQRAVVVLANFLDKQVELSVDQVKGVLEAMDSYFRESSYGDTFFMFAVPESAVTLNLRSDVRDIAAVRKEVVHQVDPFIDFTQFNRIIVFLPFWECGAGSVGEITIQTADGPIRASDAYITDDTFGCANPRAVSHEVAHGMGIWHANRLECSGSFEAVGPGGCTSIEYGDPTDMMGNGFFWNGTTILPLHMNAYHKTKLGWLRDSNIFTTLGGTYTIEPLETPGTGIKLLRLPYDGDYYYIEYRQPNAMWRDRGPGVHLPFFVNVSTYNGAVLHFAPRFISANPGSDSNLISAGSETVLTIGQSYIDSLSGYNITVLDVTPTGLKVQISSPFTVDPAIDGVRIAGPVAQTPTLLAGRTAVFTVVLKNNGNADAIKVGVNINNEVTGEIIGSAIAAVIPAGGSAEVDISWVPPQPGHYELSAEISPPLPGDTNLGNNKVLLPTDVINP